MMDQISEAYFTDSGYVDLIDNLPIDELKQLTPAHWFMLKQLCGVDKVLDIFQQLDQDESTPRLKLMLQEENIKDSILWLYRLETEHDLGDLDHVQQIECHAEISIENRLFRGQFSNSYFLQNLDRHLYSALNKPGAQISSVEGLDGAIVDESISSSLHEIERSFSEWPESRLGQNCCQIQKLIQASDWVGLAQRSDTKYRELVTFLATKDSNSLQESSDGEESSYVLLEILKEKMLREEECDDQPVIINGWEEFPWGLGGVSIPRDLPQDTQQLLARQQRELESIGRPVIARDDITADRIEGWGDEFFKTMLDSGLRLEPEVIRSLSEGKGKVYAEIVGEACPYELLTRNYLLGQSEVLPNSVTQKDILTELKRFGRTLNSLKNSVNRLLKSGAKQAYHALHEAVETNLLNGVIHSINFKDYKSHGDVYQSLRLAMLNKLNENLGIQMLFYGLISASLLVIAFYLLVIDSILAMMVLLLPTAVSVHQFSDIIQRKQYNDSLLPMPKPAVKGTGKKEGRDDSRDFRRGR